MSRRLSLLVLACVGAASSLAADLGTAGSGPFGKQEQIYLVSTAGKLTRLTDSQHGSLYPSWSPDGRRLAFLSGNAIVIATTGGRPLARISSPGSFFGDPPAWSPDGRRLALTGVAASELSATVFTVDADGRARRTVARVRAGTADASRGPVWSPDGRRLVFAVQGPETGGQGGVRASGELDLVSTAADGTGRHRLTSAAGSEFSPAWEPNGQSILYLAAPPNDGPGSNREWLRIVSAGDGRSRTVVALGEGGSASWSPDGFWIAFIGWLPGEARARLYVVRPDGSGLRRLTGEVMSEPLAWSPDSRSIAYATYGGAIETIGPDGNGHRTVLALPGVEVGSLAWSPDGKTIAFDARRTPPES